MKPYADLAAPLAKLGAENATLIADDGYTGGNLRVLFPEARLVTGAIPARSPRRDKCFFVWEEGDSKPQAAARDRFARKAFWQTSEPLRATYLSGSWPHLFRQEGWRTTWWGVAELDPDDPACR